jgi:hypothetical protein
VACPGGGAARRRRGRVSGRRRRLSGRAAGQLDGRTDINDVYVFTSRENPNNTVLIMTVNPGAGVFSPETFDPNARYQFLIDNDRDARANLTYQFRFGPEGTNQRAKLKLNGERLARGKVGEEIPVEGGGKMTAGIFDDPFFFDLDGFKTGTFTGDDFFAGLNVSAIVLEVPTDTLTDRGSANPDGHIGIIGQTKHRRTMKLDRMGRPLINTVLIPKGLKDDFNAGYSPNDKRAFLDDILDSLSALSSLPRDSSFVVSLGNALVPDLLSFDTNLPLGFPNGRRLEDDVADTLLTLFTAGKVTGDGVDANDMPFSNTFPYLTVVLK